MSTEQVGDGEIVFSSLSEEEVEQLERDLEDLYGTLRPRGSIRVIEEEPFGVIDQVKAWLFGGPHD